MLNLMPSGAKFNYTQSLEFYDLKFASKITQQENW